MDLRPHIAAEITKALSAEPDQAKWQEIILGHLQSKSIPLGAYSSNNPEVIEAFLSKYPVLRPNLAKIRLKADGLEPGVQVTLTLQNDPEMCHVCHEGQTLGVHVLFHMEGGIDDPVWQGKREALYGWWSQSRTPDMLHLSAGWPKE